MTTQAASVVSLSDRLTDSVFAAPSPVYPPAAPIGHNVSAAATKENPMPDINPAPPVRFAPVPLVSGTMLTDESGAAHPVATVEIVVTCEDGTTQTVALEERHGGWWVPKDKMGG